MEKLKPDRVYVSSRREALMVLVIFILALTWTVGYSLLYGYPTQPQPLTFVLGFPSWVFWGVIAPWAACIVISLLFGSVFVRDEDLGVEVENPDSPSGLGDTPSEETRHA